MQGCPRCIKLEKEIEILKNRLEKFENYGNRLEEFEILRVIGKENALLKARNERLELLNQELLILIDDLRARLDSREIKAPGDKKSDNHDESPPPGNSGYLEKVKEKKSDKKG